MSSSRAKIQPPLATSRDFVLITKPELPLALRDVVRLTRMLPGTCVPLQRKPDGFIRVYPKVRTTVAIGTGGILLKESSSRESPRSSEILLNVYEIGIYEHEEEHDFAG
jgi:hypothetical protein